MVSHFPPELVLAVADQENVPPPELRTVMLKLDGLLPPGAALNDSDDGDINNDGEVGLVRVRVTLAVCGVLVAPMAVIWTLPL